MTKRHIALIMTILMATTLFTGCSPKKPPVITPRAERVLRMDESNLGFPSVYTVSRRGRGFLLTSFLFDTLTWKDENGIVPLLATEWKASDDSLSYEFTLARNVKFTDGTKLTAKDVKFSYDYIKQYPHPWVALDMVEEVEVINDYKVKIVLNEVYAPFLTEVAGNVPIMPEHIWKDVSDPAKFNTPDSVIGSGPFTLENYDATAGSYIFVANKEYFLGEPVIDKLIFSNVSQPVQALKAGEIDAAQRISISQANQLKSEGQYTVIEGPGLWVYRMYFNFARPELNETALRQAMYYAINRQEVVEKAALGEAIAGNPGHIHPASEWYHSDVKNYDFNVEEAKAILDAAGMSVVPNGLRSYRGKELKFELLVVNDRMNEAEMVKAYFCDIGIGVSIKAMDQASVDALIDEGKFDIALNGHGSFGGDPVLLARFSVNNQLGATPSITAQGGSLWSNEEFNQLFAQQMKELDSTQRFQQVARLQQIISAELPTLTLYYRTTSFAYNPSALNGWFYTKDGVARAVPTVQNKLIYVKGTWGK